ncbi:hypothetical protein [Clostridium tertium]|uniref:Lipoprotein n=1 Tax=Clostridium tertium TaxID=1559 RepID=A0A6N3D0S8_9CLOT
MKNRVKLFISILLCALFLIGCDKNDIAASEVLDLIQSDYISIEIKDKTIDAEGNQQYLIDDFIPKLSRYTLRMYDKEIPTEYSNKVYITNKDGTKIRLFDNKYIRIEDSTYEIISGSIDLDKFYQFIE